MYGKSNIKTYIIICKIDSQWEFAVWLEKLKWSSTSIQRGDGREVGWRFKGEEIYVSLELIRVEV